MMEQARLIGRIQESLSDLELVIARAESAMQKAEQTGDEAYWDSVALSLHGYYAGVERVFEDIARTIDGGIPESPRWHQDLLLQMAAEIAGIRPPVVSSATRRCLDEYQRFRHVVRHVYAFQFRPSRLKELTRELRACYDALHRDLVSFIQFLTQV